jgi:hypothetical protein
MSGVVVESFIAMFPCGEHWPGSDGRIAAAAQPGERGQAPPGGNEHEGNPQPGCLRWWVPAAAVLRDPRRHYRRAVFELGLGPHDRKGFGGKVQRIGRRAVEEEAQRGLALHEVFKQPL